MKKLIGHVLSGSLSDGFMIRINADTALEDIKTGKFVCVQGTIYRFFCLVTDLQLEVTHPDILLFPPSKNEFVN